MALRAISTASLSPAARSNVPASTLRLARSSLITELDTTGRHYISLDDTPLGVLERTARGVRKEIYVHDHHVDCMSTTKRHRICNVRISLTRDKMSSDTRPRKRSIYPVTSRWVRWALAFTVLFGAAIYFMPPARASLLVTNATFLTMKPGETAPVSATCSSMIWQDHRARRRRAIRKPVNRTHTAV